jgi:hypothetical protein
VDDTVGLGFNLDSEENDAEIAKGIGISSWEPGYFAKHTISLPPGQQQVFDLYAITSTHSCSFRYQATILDGDHKVNQLIGNGPRPFRVTALAGKRIPMVRYSQNIRKCISVARELGTELS